jgi:ribosome-binding factor A
VSARRRDSGRERVVGPSQRQLRVGEELRHALVQILRDNHARDPDLRDANVTVTEVRLSPDLGNATAFVMPLGGQKSGSIIAALNRASIYFRTQAAHVMQLRHAPRISFALDTSFSYAEKIDGLLHAPEVQRDLTGDADSEASESEAPDSEASGQD